jgi:hypothetical protein
MHGESDKKLLLWGLSGVNSSKGNKYVLVLEKDLKKNYPLKKPKLIIAS